MSILTLLKTQIVTLLAVPEDTSRVSYAGEIPLMPAMRVVAITTLGWDDRAQLIELLFAYRGLRSYPVTVTYWMLAEDMLLGIAMKELRAAAKRRYGK